MENYYYKIYKIVDTRIHKPLAEKAYYCDIDAQPYFDKIEMPLHIVIGRINSYTKVEKKHFEIPRKPREYPPGKL